MIKVFIPEIKGKVKTSVRGFWRNDKGVLFYDYLKIGKAFYGDLEFHKKHYHQESLFFINEVGQGFIYYNRDKQEVLSNRIYKEVIRANLKQEIKEALGVYSGVTIYIKGNKYFKEIFYR